jgi:hypothetical protein
MLSDEITPAIGLERGWQATGALQHLQRPELVRIRSQASFRPISDEEIVPILPCNTCRDGGLRVMGRVKRRGHIQRVHACDTCGVAQFFELP